MPRGTSPSTTFSSVMPASRAARSRSSSNFLPVARGVIIDLEDAPAGFAEDPENCFVEKRGTGRFHHTVIDIDVGDLAGHMPQVVIGDTVHRAQAVVWLIGGASAIIAVDLIAIFLSLVRKPSVVLRDEGDLEDIVNRVDRDDGDEGFEPLLDEHIAHVHAGDEDRLDPGLCRCLDLVGHATDREDIPADREGPGHGNILPDGDTLNCTDHGGCHTDRCRIALDTHVGPDELDVDIDVLDILAR